VTAELNPVSAVRCKYAGTPECCDPRWHDRAGTEFVGDKCTCGGARQSGKGWSTEKLRGVLANGTLKRSTTRTALQRGAPEKDKLFTRSALVTDITLRGTLVLSGDRADLSRAIDWLMTDRELSIGGQRSTLGRCRWTCSETSPPKLPTGEVVLRLRSPAILVDEFGAATTDLAGAVSDEVARSKGRGRAERHWVRPVTVAGWNGMAGLPKSEEYAVDAGSTVIITDLDEVGAMALSRGLGLRQVEGYGSVELLSRDGVTTREQLPAATAPMSKGEGTRTSSGRHVESITAATQRAAEVDEQTDSVAPIAPDPIPVPVDESGDEPKMSEVEALLNEIGPARTPATLKGLLAQARLVRRWRENGFAEALVRAQVVEPMNNLPWMRNLSQAHQTRVQAVVSAPAEMLAEHLRMIERLIAEQQ